MSIILRGAHVHGVGFTLVVVTSTHCPVGIVCVSKLRDTVVDDLYLVGCSAFRPRRRQFFVFFVFFIKG